MIQDGKKNVKKDAGASAVDRTGESNANDRTPEAAAAPKRKGRVKKEQAPEVQLDFEQSPHLREMPLPWQRFYEAVRQSMEK